jgi:hypothetical protein
MHYCKSIALFIGITFAAIGILVAVYTWMHPELISMLVPNETPISK